MRWAFGRCDRSIQVRPKTHLLGALSESTPLLNASVAQK